MMQYECFPTPDTIAIKMVSHYADKLKKKGRVAIDPHGGTGALLDRMKSIRGGEWNSSEIFTVELDPELRLLLQGKGYKVIGTDWLQYNEPVRFDVIVMNPPFSDGVKHVLKGWECLNDGGGMTALLNAESLRNPYTKERANLLNLLALSVEERYEQGQNPTPVLTALRDQHKIEWLGRCFKGSERDTDVDVVMLRLEKPKRKLSFDIDTENFDHDAPLDETAYSENPLAHQNAIKNLVIRYDTALKIITERHQAQSKLDFYLDGISSPVYDENRRRNEEPEGLKQEASLAQQVAQLKSRFWNTVFTRTKLSDKLTSDYRKRFQEIVLHQANIAFTESNIEELLMGFFANRTNIMLECIGNVFDMATKYHEDNRVHNEGWKTNKGYRVNKRIIMPGVVTCEDYFGFRENYYGNMREFVEDLDKVMHWLAGTNRSDFTSTYRSLLDAMTACNKKGESYQQAFDSHFFKFRFFKKGTLHLDFKDLSLLEDFNVMAAREKKWLGNESSYKTKRERKAEAPKQESRALALTR